MTGVHDLRPGDVFTYHDTAVTVLRGSESRSDRFGQPLVAYWCSRADTGAAGFMSFGVACELELDVSRPLDRPDT